MKQVLGLLIFGAGVLIAVVYFGPLLFGGKTPHSGNLLMALGLSLGAMYVGGKWMKGNPDARNGFRYGRK